MRSSIAAAAGPSSDLREFRKGHVGVVRGRRSRLAASYPALAGNGSRRFRSHFRVQPFEKSSGRRDSNPRPLDPQSSALPSCATSRNRSPATRATDPHTLAQSPRRRRRCRPSATKAAAVATPCLGSRPDEAGPGPAARRHPEDRLARGRPARRVSRRGESAAEPPRCPAGPERSAPAHERSPLRPRPRPAVRPVSARHPPAHRRDGHRRARVRRGSGPGSCRRCAARCRLHPVARAAGPGASRRRPAGQLVRR